MSLVASSSVLAANARADDVWQWSAPVETVVSSETNDHPRAYLWIPPNCKQVRAVMVGQHNLLEEPVLQNPILRKTLGELGIAEVWVTPAFDGIFRFDKGAGEQFEGMMQALAQTSGYQELASAPVIPIGHSAMAGFPYYFAAWNPGRTLVAISFKGQWPDSRNTPDFDWDNSRLNGVPLLYINGEYEDANGRAPKALSFKNRFPQVPLTMVADPGAGHFDSHDKIVEYIALYLKKVCRYRLPAKSSLEGPVALKPIDPNTSGWLYDRWRLNVAPQAEPAPVGKYTGDPKEAFWAFDEELARATHAYEMRYRNQKPQLLGYIQDGKVVEQNPKTHFQVPLAFRPMADGVTFKLDGTFIETVPEGRPPSWTGLPAGSAIEHPQGGAIDIEVMTGPLKKLDANTFTVRFNRVGFNNAKRSGDIWFTAVHEGDGVFKRAVQQAYMRIPAVNTAGTDQSITFEAIPDQKVGAKPIRLGATSSAGVPISYYVQEGPAELDGDTLRFTAIPPRAKFPMKVTVVAYQWGRTTEPRMKSAVPVVRSFYIRR